VVYRDASGDDRNGNWKYRMEKRFDVLVVGELNVDLILDGLGTFPEVGKEVLANKMNLVLGSSSAIFASNISSLGL